MTALTEHQLARIPHATLLIWGDEDAFGGVDVAEAATELIPRAELRIIPGGGHVPWVGHPK
jgi:pimeloyl-ACP methyl ester carboxylesterase